MSRHPRFATSLHPEPAATTSPPETIAFVGYSWPHFAQIQQASVSTRSKLSLARFAVHYQGPFVDVVA
jgi:hypothetical protein